MTAQAREHSAAHYVPLWSQNITDIRVVTNAHGFSVIVHFIDSENESREYLFANTFSERRAADIVMHLRGMLALINFGAI